MEPANTNTSTSTRQAPLGDALLSFAAPLLATLPDDAPPSDTRQMCLLAAAVWNYLVAFEGNRFSLDPARLKMIRMLATAVGISTAALNELLDVLAARKATLFPDDDRLVSTVRVDPRDGDGELRLEVIEHDLRGIRRAMG